MWVDEEMKMSDDIKLAIQLCKNGEYTGADVMKLWCFAESSQRELERLTKENRSLTELAAQKASRADELFEALINVLDCPGAFFSGANETPRDAALRLIKEIKQESNDE